jgi:hypothetical protein
MLSGIRRANADDTRSVVWNRVETYTFDRTPLLDIRILDI